MKFRFQYRETIVTVICDDGLRGAAEDALFEARRIVESRISEDPFFGITYDPYPPSKDDDDLIRMMCEASVKAGVGPMAGVAGAVAYHSARRLVEAGSSVAVVENGGDIAFYSRDPMPVGIFADHPVLRDMAFMMSSDRITGVCSSSRTVGPSVSLGRTSISTVFSDDVVLADCCATALGNLITSEEELAPSLESIGSIEGVKGCLACCDDKVAMFGDIPELVPADCSGITYRPGTSPPSSGGPGPARWITRTKVSQHPCRGGWRPAS